MKRLKLLFTGLSLFLGWNIADAQIIPADFLGINGWRPVTVGGGATPTSSITCTGLQVTPQIPCVVSGSVQTQWSPVQSSGVKLVRYGGITADQNLPNDAHYIEFIDSVRSKGMEPIIQIPINQGGDGTPLYDTSAAKTVYNMINGTGAGQYNRKVVYWSIGNEPDQPTPKGYGYSTLNDAWKIAAYIKNTSIALRRAAGSFSIKIMGPELAEWNNDPNYTKKKMVDSLVGNNVHGRCDIMGTYSVTGKAYIDYFTFHQYGWDGDIASPTRATAIGKLRSTYNFATSLSYLQTQVAAANSYHGRTTSNPVLVAVTEGNTTYQTISNDNWNDVKANGFYSGQHWLEMASIALENSVSFISYWSAVEGSQGYMKTDGTKKSTYHHFKMLADDFKYCTDYKTATDQNSGGSDIVNIKAFGAKNGAKYVVVVLNQDDSAQANTTFSLRLDGTFPTSNTARIKLGFSGAPTTTYTNTIDKASTMVLVFDCGGTIAKITTYKQSQGAVGTPSISNPGSVIYADLGPDITTCCGTLTTPAMSGATYAWYTSTDNYTNALPGATSNTYSGALGTKTYKVKVTKGSCIAEDYCLVTQSGPSCCRALTNSYAVTEKRSELLNCVPNPAENKTTIYYSHSDAGSGEIIVYDVFGKALHRIPIKPEEGKIELDCSLYANGIYVCAMTVGGRIAGIRKLVIAK
jgi:hypothetical protein